VFSATRTRHQHDVITIHSPGFSIVVLLQFPAPALVNAAPANDACLNAEDISLSLNAIGDSTEATSDFASTTCSVLSTNTGVWYKFTPSADKIIEARITGATFNSRLAVFTGTCALPSCLLNNDGGGNTAFLSWQGSAGTEYLLLVTGVTGATVGTFTLDIQVSLWLFSMTQLWRFSMRQLLQH